jgi:hypothetical protein
MSDEPKATPDWSRAPADAQFWGPKKHGPSWNEGWYKRTEDGKWVYRYIGQTKWVDSSLNDTNPERYADRLDQLIARPPAALDSNDVDSW